MPSYRSILLLFLMISPTSGPSDMGGALPPPIEVAKKEITCTAIGLALDDSIAAQQQLRRELAAESWLHELNSEFEYLGLAPQHLQLTFILEALASNGADSARETLNLLAVDPRFTTPGPFMTVLIEASAGVTNPPSHLIDLWRAQLKPGASELQRTIGVLVANGSQEAIGLFEAALLEEAYREDYVVSWLRDAVLRHRQDVRLLEACFRLLQHGEWPERYKRTLVDVLFDYKPEAWYHLETPPPHPPSREQMTEEVRALLLRIATVAREDRLLKRGQYRQIRAELEDNPPIF